jgi:hypothetical protein
MVPVLHVADPALPNGGAADAQRAARAAGRETRDAIAGEVAPRPVHPRASATLSPTGMSASVPLF